MIPLRDNIPARRYPIVTVAPIAANVFVFLHEAALGPSLEDFIRTFGFVTARYPYLTAFAPHALLARFGPMLTSMFLHGGWAHLIGNMWVLWIFDMLQRRIHWLSCSVARPSFRFPRSQSGSG